MIRRRAAVTLVVCVVVAFFGDVLLSTFAAEVVAGIALAVGLCCLPERES